MLPALTSKGASKATENWILRQGDAIWMILSPCQLTMSSNRIGLREIIEIYYCFAINDLYLLYLSGSSKLLKLI